MSKRRSLDDTCDVFLSRRRVRSPLACQRAASECTPTLCADNITVPPYFLFTGTLELPELAAAAPIRSTKPLPVPGSSGVAQPKAARLLNGRSHVPRPRNPFILFRCDFVHQRRTMPRSDLDDTNISRMAGDLWRDMTPAQRRPWLELAAKEKAQHAKLYPNYKYAPTHSGPKTKKTKKGAGERTSRQASQTGSPAEQPQPRHQVERPCPYPQPNVPRRRSSSCPPVGAAPVPSHSPLDEWSPVRVAQDDMQRRPSRTVMYSVVQPSIVEPVAPAPFDPVVPSHGLDWLGLPQIDPTLLDPAYPLPDLNHGPDSYPAPGLAYFDPKPTFLPGVSDPGLSLRELAELGRFTVDTSFTDPFSTLGYPMNHCPFPVAVPPLDYSGYSAGSPSSSSSGTFTSH